MAIIRCVTSAAELPEGPATEGRHVLASGPANGHAHLLRDRRRSSARSPSARTKASWRGTSASHTCQLSDAVLDGRVAIPAARRSDPRGSEGLRLPASARAAARSADGASDRLSRRCSRRSQCSPSSGLTLWVLDVRDPRCFAAAALWVPTISGVLLSNLSIPLTLALAVAWRYRDRVGTLRAGASVWPSRQSSSSGRCSSG